MSTKKGQEELARAISLHKSCFPTVAKYGDDVIKSILMHKVFDALQLDITSQHIKVIERNNKNIYYISDQTMSYLEDWNLTPAVCRELRIEIRKPEVCT